MYIYIYIFENQTNKNINPTTFFSMLFKIKSENWDITLHKVSKYVTKTLKKDFMLKRAFKMIKSLE